MKTVFALSLLAAAVSASPAVSGHIWTATFHTDTACASDSTGTTSIQTDGSCDSSTVIPDGVGSVFACNQDETTEGVIFYADNACTADQLKNFASNVDPKQCECINFSTTGAINSAKVVPANS